jgi:hypothetical protein
MSANFIRRPVKSRFFWAAGIVSSLTVLATGCAQQRAPGYYDQPAATSLSDAQYESSGASYQNLARAPSQLQIALQAPARTTTPQAQPGPAAGAATGASTDTQAPPTSISINDVGASNPNAPRTAAEANAAGNTTAAGIHPELAKVVPQPETYLGTLPCLSPGMQCNAERFVLTLSPNGRWRARTAYLNAGVDSGQPIVEQGCWGTSSAQPPHVVLMDLKGNARADFILAANNVLQLGSMDGVQPNLAYHLTRQPDLDPIDEVGRVPAGACQ